MAEEKQDHAIAKFAPLPVALKKFGNRSNKENHSCCPIKQ